MTSKERVRAALEHREPDRIPFGEFAIDFDTVERILGHETYLRAKAKSQIAFWEGRRDEVVQSWKEDTVELYRKLDCIDIVNVSAMASSLAPPRDYDPNPPRRVDEKTWEYPDGRVLKLSETTRDITLVHDPLLWEREYRVEDYAADPIDTPPDPSVFEVVDYVIEHLGQEKYLLGGSGTGVEMTMLGDMERALSEYVMNPEIVHAAARFNLKKGNLDDQFFIRPGIDAVFWGQDFAYKSGPMISPEMFAEFVVPYTQQRVKRIHEHYHLPVFKHACGNNWKLLDQFVEIGWDCYQSIQPTAEMDLAEVKKRYGDKLCLWGGVPVEHLMGGSPEQVRRDVVSAVTAGRTGGGYIFGTSHSIAVGTRYDNFLAMLDEFDKVRDRPAIL